MDRCKDCKYFRKEDLYVYDTGFGECSKLEKLREQDKERSGVYIEFKGEAYLKVGANFGYIHFERREE